MKKKYFIPYIIGSLLLCTAFFTSCDDDENLGEAPRLFSPQINKSKIESPANWILISWDRYVGSKKYLVELSQDTFATAPIHTAEVDTTFYKFTDLKWGEKYQVRMTAFGDNIKSKPVITYGLQTSAYPTKMNRVIITDIAIRIMWEVAGENYTSIVVSKGKEVIKTVEVSAEEYADGSKIITGLSPETTYSIEAYSGTDYKGKVTLTTIKAQVFEGNVVDLRELSDAEALGYITTAFIAGLEDNTTVVLNGGTVYNINGPSFTSKSVKFITGYSLLGPAQFSMASDLKIPAGVNVPKIEFEGIYFYTPNVDNSTSNYGGKYVFNLNTAANASLISFENCQIRYFRGIFRLQSGPVIEKARINRCTIDRIGGYGILNVDNSAATMGEMVLSNSTITYADKLLVNSKANTTTSVLVDGCTIYASPASGSYGFDFNGMSPKVVMKNNILGYSANASFYRSASKDLTFENNHQTSDCKIAVDANSLKVGEFPDVKIYSGSSTDLFADPSNFDFTIKDNKFEGAKTAGAPTWRMQ